MNQKTINWLLGLGLLASLGLLALVLVGGNQSAPNPKQPGLLGGLTNYDELALNDAKSYKAHNLSISSDTVLTVTATNTDSFTQWIDPESLTLITSGTTTGSSYRIQGQATSTTGNFNAFTLMPRPNLLDETIATSSGPQQRVASSTATRLVPWLAGQAVEFTIRATFAEGDPGGAAAGTQPATSSLRNLGTLNFLWDTWSTSTLR